MSSRFCTLLLTTTALVPLGLTPAIANPLGAQVVGGNATVQGQGTANVTVTQSTDKAIVNWNTFNIGANEKTQFIQPNSSSIALNRVTGGLGPSQIFGSLSANGRIFVVNPDGILVGPGAKIDTAGFLATTHDIANADFMAGRYNFSIPGRPDASVVNQGTITAQNGGFAALVAPGVRNSGTITARLGTVALASGNGFTLDFYGDKLITLGVNDSIAATVKDVSTGQPLSSLVSNEGKLKANGGTVELTAVSARQVVDSVINNKGVIEANTIGTHNGMIVLGAATAASKPANAPTQTVKVSGKLSSAGKKKGTKGGTIQVTGEDITLTGATLNASGRGGGGTVLIGGDVGGGNPAAAVASIPQAKLQPYAVPTASTLTVDAATTINASAEDSGNGGKVVVWSDKTTTFDGIIVANGGASSGNGGFVETSGHQLAFNGTVDASAPKGHNGVLLLDPKNLTIQSAGPDTVTQLNGASDTSVGASNNAHFEPTGGASVLSTTTLENALASLNIIIYSKSGAGGEAGDIIVSAPVTWVSANTLGLSSANNIAINAAISAPNGGLSVAAGSASKIITAAGEINVASFRLEQGIWTQIASSLPAFSAKQFDLTNSSTGLPNGMFVRAVGGDGSNVAPYQIADVYGLQGIAQPGGLSNSYVLANDIEAGIAAGWNQTGNVGMIIPTGFTPIGTLSNKFSGQFDGNGHVIKDLTVNSLNANVGLFGVAGSSAQIKNIGLTNASISGSDSSSVGGLVGYSRGTITQTFVSGAVSGGSNSNVGGLVGKNEGSIIQSFVSGFVGAGVSSTVGGLVGYNSGNISQSYSVASVLAGGSSVVGGLVGLNVGGSISQSYSTGSVQADGISPALVGNLPFVGIPAQMFVAGHYVYVAENSAGLRIYDIADPQHPFFVGAYAPSQGSLTLSVLISGRYAYVGDVFYGLNVLDVSNPASPAFVGNYSFAGITATYGSAIYANSIVKNGNSLYMTDYNNGAVHILDVSDPTSPTLKGSYIQGPNASAPYVLAIKDQYLLVADVNANVINVLDTSNPSNPVKMGQFAATGRYCNGFSACGQTGITPWGLKVVGNYMYVADVGFGFYVLDVSNITAPRIVGQYNPIQNSGFHIPYSNSFYDVSVVGDYAYIADAGKNKLLVLNISNPAHPILAGSYNLGTGWPTTVLSTGQNVYLASYSSGGLIFSIDSVGATLGGLLGSNTSGGTVTNSYWDVQSSSQATSAAGSSRTTGQLTSALPSGFDVTVWASSPTVNSGYPSLRWQVPATAITITADSLFKVYGATDPTLTYNITSGSLSGSDAFTGALTRAAGENVGSYSITLGSISLPPIYTLAYVGGTLTITSRPVTVTADAKSKTYGTPSPALTYQITGGSLVGSDAFTGGLVRTPGENAGLYGINQGTLSLSSNYAITYLSANLTINTAPLVIIADDKTRQAGTANPTFTASYSGFVSGDNSNVVSGLAYLTLATTGSPAGTYAIAPYGASASNYTISYVNGVLTVTPNSSVSLPAGTVLSPNLQLANLTQPTSTPNAGQPLISNEALKALQQEMQKLQQTAELPPTIPTAPAEYPKSEPYLTAVDGTTSIADTSLWLGKGPPLSTQEFLTKALPYANYSNQVYDSDPLSPNGWITLAIKLGIPAADIEQAKAWGFSAALYKNGDRTVIAFRGTTTDPNNPATIPDANTDIQNALGLKTVQYDFAVEFIAALQRRAQDYPNLILTGYSLGGGLAGYAGANLKVPAITFNAAPILVGNPETFSPEYDINLRVNHEFAGDYGQNAPKVIPEGHTILFNDQLLYNYGILPRPDPNMELAACAICAYQSSVGGEVDRHSLQKSIELYNKIIQDGSVGFASPANSSGTVFKVDKADQ